MKNLDHQFKFGKLKTNVLCQLAASVTTAGGIVTLEAPGPGRSGLSENLPFVNCMSLSHSTRIGK